MCERKRKASKTPTQKLQPSEKPAKRHAAQYTRLQKRPCLTKGLCNPRPPPGQALTAQNVLKGADDDPAVHGGGDRAAATAQQQLAPEIDAAARGTHTAMRDQERQPTTRSVDRGPSSEEGGGDSSQSPSQTEGSLRPSELTSPLSKQVVKWYEELTKVHKQTCTSKTNCCARIRPLHITCKEVTSKRLCSCPQYQCLQAVEAELLLHSLYYGFPVLPEGTVPTDYPKARTANYPCPERARTALSTAVDEEIRLGILRVVGTEPHQLTALTYKDEKGGKVRPIRDYSAPHDGTAVNAHWPSRHFKMMGLQDAYTLMTPLCYMAKVDIKSAFRTVSVRPDQQDVLSFDWPDADSHRSRFLRDTRLPFGWTGSPKPSAGLQQQFDP